MEVRGQVKSPKTAAIRMHACAQCHIKVVEVDDRLYTYSLAFQQSSKALILSQKKTPLPLSTVGLHVHLHVSKNSLERM